MSTTKQQSNLRSPTNHKMTKPSEGKLTSPKMNREQYATQDAGSLKNDSPPHKRHKSIVEDSKEFPHNAYLPKQIRDQTLQESTQWKESLLAQIDELVHKFQNTDEGIDHVQLQGTLRKLERYNELKFPFSLSEKATLIKKLYTFIEQHERVDYFDQLLVFFGIISLIKRKETLDLVVDWRPLYRLIDVTYFTKYRKVVYTPKSHANVLIALVRQIKRYFAPGVTAELFEEFRPLLCLHDHLLFKAQGFICLFLPTNHRETYWIPEIVNVWKWIGLYPTWDSQFLQLFARTAKQSIGKINWDPYLEFLFQKMTIAFELPIGTSSQLYDEYPMDECSIFTSFDYAKTKSTRNAAKLIVWSFGSHADSNASFGYLKRLMKSIESFYHPSNEGEWTEPLAEFMLALARQFGIRKQLENDQPEEFSFEDQPAGSKKKYVPKECCLSEEFCKEFVGLLYPLALKAMYSKSHHMQMCANHTLKHLVYVQPNVVFPPLLEQCFHALQTLTETHQTVAALEVLSLVAFPLVRHSVFPDGAEYLADIMNLTLPGIDNNDYKKTWTTFKFYTALLVCLPLFGENKGGTAPRAVNFFEDWCFRFLDRIFSMLQNEGSAGYSHNNVSNDYSSAIFRGVCELFFSQLSPDIHAKCLKKVFNFVSTEFLVNTKENIGNLCDAVSFSNPKAALKLFVPLCHDRLVDAKTGKLQQLTDNEKMWYAHILAQVVHRAGEELIPYQKQICKVVELLIDNEEKKINQSVRRLIQNYVNALTLYYTRDIRSQNPSVWDQLSKGEHWNYWSAFPCKDELEVVWHVPSRKEIIHAVEFVNRFLVSVHNNMREFIDQVRNDKTVTYSRNSVKAHFNTIESFMRCAPNFMPELRSENEDPSAQIYPDSKTIFCGKINYAPEQGEPPLKISLADIVDLCCDASNILFRKQRDVSTLIPTITKSFFPLTCIRCGTLRSTFKSRKNSHKIAKQHNFKTFTKEKDQRYPRYLLVARVNLDLSFRNVLYNEMLPYTEHHEKILETLLQLSLSSYQQVKKKVHAYFMGAIHRFSTNVTRKFMPLIIDTLTNPESTDDQVTGALALLSKGNSQNTITTDWNLLSRVLLSLCKTQHVKKESTQSKIAEVYDMYFNAMYQLGLQSPKQVEVYNQLIRDLIGVLDSNQQMHWKYQTMASSFLMLLVRADNVLFPIEGIKWLLKALASDTNRIRIISAEAVNLILAQYRPVQPQKEVDSKEKHFLGKWAQLPTPTNEEEFTNCEFHEKNYYGWYITPKKTMVYDYSKPCAGPNPEVEQKREELKKMAREVMDDAWMEKFFKHHTHRDDSYSETYAQMYKGLFQIFGMEFYEKGKPYLEKIAQQAGSGKLDESGHMATASEFVSGLIRGMKHWRFDDQQKIYKELIEYWDRVLDKCSQGCVTEWSEGFEFATSDKDPRRIRPMVEYFFNRFQQTIGKASTNLQTRYIKFMYGIVGEISWRDTDLMSRILMELSNHLHHPYQQVREYISMMIALIMKTIWYPSRDETTGRPALRMPSSHSSGSDVVMKDAGDESSTSISHVPADLPEDEMTTTNGDPTESVFPTVGEFMKRVLKQMEKDDNGTLVLLHKLQYSSNVEDPKTRKELQGRLLKCFSDTTLTFMSSLFCSCAPHPVERYTTDIVRLCATLQDQSEEGINSDAFDTLQTVANFPFSPADAKNVLTFIVENFSSFTNWRLRKSLLSFLNVFIFRHQFALQEERKVLFQLLVQGLKDAQVEVRQIASATLAGYLKISDETEVQRLASEFRNLAKDPFKNRQKRRRRSRGSRPSVMSPQNRKHQEDIVARHAGVLGLRAIVTAYPHEIPEFLPPLLVLLAKYSHDRVQQIRESVKKTFSDFWKCHRDSWRIQKKQFDEDQLADLTDVLVSPGYYA